MFTHTNIGPCTSQLGPMLRDSCAAATCMHGRQNYHVECTFECAVYVTG